jgi:hypothetical protein
MICHNDNTPEGVFFVVKFMMGASMMGNETYICLFDDLLPADYGVVWRFGK